jgi:hypothetical protein
MGEAGGVRAALLELGREARELYLGPAVPELAAAPGPLAFHRWPHAASGCI